MKVDEEDTCEYVKKLLQRCGVACDTVISGKKALRCVQSREAYGHPYDLCMIDWNMADMDGLETARQIRKAEGQTLPIIIATAYDYSSIEEEAKAADVTRSVSKPLFNLLVNTFGKYEPAEPEKESEGRFPWHQGSSGRG